MLTKKTRFELSNAATRGFSPLIGAALLVVFSSLPARADLVLETETAELGKKGDSLVF